MALRNSLVLAKALLVAKKNLAKYDDIEKELSALHETASDLMDKAQSRSAFLLFDELRTKARAEGQLGYYVIGTFFQMNLAQRLLQYELSRERAIELVAIFEEEEQARKIEPSLDLEQYGNMVYAMGACAYEVLADATGELEGYNSEGMQECLTGGIEVCHRIGKLSCINCFREYATEIHASADDFELARFHCNQVLQNDSERSERGDRRWMAMLRLALLDLMEGQHDASRAKTLVALDLSRGERVNDSPTTRVAIGVQLRTLDLLDGRESEEIVLELLSDRPERDECPELDFTLDMLTSLEHSMKSNWLEAEALLAPWLRSLKQNHATTKWLEAGVRMSALYRLQGNLEKARRLSKQFEELATKANDWQVIRRLSQILDESAEVTPLGTVVRNTLSPKSISHSEPKSIAKVLMDSPLRRHSEEAKVDSSKSESEVSESKPDLRDREKQTDTPELEHATSQTPLGEKLLTIAKQINLNPYRVDKDNTVYEAVKSMEALREELLGLEFRSFTHPEDVAQALYIVRFMINPACDRGEVWRWANRLVTSHQDVGYLISLLARLGMSIRMVDRLNEVLFQESLDDDDEDADWDDEEPDLIEEDDDHEWDGSSNPDSWLDDSGDEWKNGPPIEDAIPHEPSQPDAEVWPDFMWDVDEHGDRVESDAMNPEKADPEVGDAFTPFDPGEMVDFFKSLHSDPTMGPDRDWKEVPPPDDNDSGELPFRDAHAADISTERLDQLVRKSLQLDSSSAYNCYRAGEIFEYIRNESEAERCFARAFKLDRTFHEAALALSRIYAETDRLQDALYVLDLCIREGGDSPQLFFEAGVKAHALTQYELQVSFLQRLLERYEPLPWTYYYLSSGLLELKRPKESLDAITMEVTRFKSSGMHIDSILALVYAQLGKSDLAVEQIRSALDTKLYDIQNLTISGIAVSFERLMSAIRICPDAKGMQSKIEERMLKAGMATESFFELARSTAKPCDVYLYQCMLMQPLDQHWATSEGCLPGQDGWLAYVAPWGVLAPSKDEAVNIALEWQSKCYPLPSSLIEVLEASNPLHDRPGIAFQGGRFADDEEDDYLDDLEEGDWDGDPDADMDGDDSPDLEGDDTDDPLGPDDEGPDDAHHR